jgi:hypothetical protein
MNTNKNYAASFALCIACLFGAVGSSEAALETFIGSDVGAGGASARPNSDGQAALFDAAASLIGNVSVIDFEAAPLGGFVNLALGSGVTLSSLTSTGSIVNTPQGSPDSLYGYNTTSGGDQFVSVFGGNLLFSFAPGINSFGAFISGLQGTAVGEQTITFFDGSSQVIDIPEISSGISFVGFTDVGKDIASISINVSNDIVGVDDVRFGRASNDVVPEPATLFVWSGLGLAAAYSYYAKKKRAHGQV